MAVDSFSKCLSLSHQTVARCPWVQMFANAQIRSPRTSARQCQGASRARLTTQSTQPTCPSTHHASRSAPCVSQHVDSLLAVLTHPLAEGNVAIRQNVLRVLPTLLQRCGGSLRSSLDRVIPFLAERLVDSDAQSRGHAVRVDPQTQLRPHPPSSSRRLGSRPLTPRASTMLHRPVRSTSSSPSSDLQQRLGRS